MKAVGHNRGAPAPYRRLRGCLAPGRHSEGPNTNHRPALTRSQTETKLPPGGSCVRPVQWPVHFQLLHNNVRYLTQVGPRPAMSNLLDTFAMQPTPDRSLGFRYQLNAGTTSFCCSNVSMHHQEVSAVVLARYQQLDVQIADAIDAVPDRYTCILPTTAT